MSDLERFAIWYVAVLVLGFVAVAVESRRERPRDPRSRSYRR